MTSESEGFIRLIGIITENNFFSDLLSENIAYEIRQAEELLDEIFS